MDQSLVHTFSWGNSYGPVVLKVLLKFPPTLVLVHGWLFPVVGVADVLHEKGGLSLRGVAVTTETATTAETAKTVKTVTAASWYCIL